MIKQFVGLMLPGAMALASCSESTKGGSSSEPELIRDPTKILTISLGPFDEQEERSKVGNLLGSVRLDHLSSNEELKRRAVADGKFDLFENIAICPIVFPESETSSGRYALTRRRPIEEDWNDYLSGQPTNLPLILRHDDWGFTTAEQHGEDHLDFRNFLSNLSNEVEAVDLTFFRVPERFSGDFSGMSNVRFMAMPWSSFDVASRQFKYPKSIEELTFYNIKLNGLFSEGDYDLENLSKLVLNGCWIDAPLSYPPFAAPEDFNRGVLPFGDVCKTIKSVDFINCDNRALLSMLYFRWDSLQSISFRRSYLYPRQDGIELFDSIIWMMIENYVNRFPSLEKISLQFGDLDQMVSAKKLQHAELPPRQKPIDLKSRLAMLAEKASIEVKVEEAVD